MSIVTHKYTPAEIPDAELQATFAARHHTVDYLLKALRDQIHSSTLASFVITGPRGAGKSTLIRMVVLRIRQDQDLNAAWLPVVFPEEQFEVASLRDLLAATLKRLSAFGVSAAEEWLRKVENEPNNEQSLQLAITGLRQLVRLEKRRLVLFIENLNLLLEENLAKDERATLRRLLMTDPCMMVIGSAVHVVNSPKNYDEAFFNYFGEVALGRLDADEVFELLRRRAEYDGNTEFPQRFEANESKIRAIAHLSGGNPRLVLMLYEVLGEKHVISAVQCLRQLVDELTPSLKDEIESLPPQQRRVFHVLVEKGGTAQPSDLVGPTRLPLNAVTTQLRRLREARFLDVLGGGKGRAAFYTVPDRLVLIWFQMRYLRQNRRRIELFVEALRTWFETCARFEAVRSRQTPRADNGPFLLREAAAVSEYRAASRAGAAFQEPECEPVPEERVRPSHEGASGTSGWRAVLRSEEARPADRRLAAAALFEALWGKGLTADALGALDLFANGLASSSSAQAGEEMLRLLGALAKPPLREAWPGAWRRLAERSSGEARQVLDFLKPVCEVLGGSKRVTLDSLPPEQREFALEVLGAFEPEAGRRARVLDRPRLGLPEPPR